MDDARCRWGCAGLVVAALAFVPASGVRSQDRSAGPAGLRFELDLSSELRFAQNPELEPDASESAAISETGLRFAIASDTRTEAFRFAIDAGLDFSTDSDVGESELAFPSLSFAYTRVASRSRLSLRADRRVSDTDQTTPIFVDLDGDGDGELILLDEVSGKVAFTSASVTLLTGIDRPIGHSLTLSVRDRDFIDIPAGAGLFGSRTTTIESTTSLRFSPVTAGSLTASLSRYSADDEENTERERHSVSLGLSTAVDETTEVRGSIGYSEIETTTIGGVEVESGIIASLAASRELPRGTVGLSFALTLDEDGPRRTLSVNRGFAFPSSTLQASVGVTRDDEGTNLVAEVDYAKDLRSGQISVSLVRGMTESATTDEDQITTSLALNYRRQVTETSSISLGLDFLHRGEGDRDLTQAGASAAYTTALTRDWDLSVGYRTRYLDDEDGEAISNLLFARVDRAFLWRP